MTLQYCIDFCYSLSSVPQERFSTLDQLKVSLTVRLFVAVKSRMPQQPPQDISMLPGKWALTSAVQAG